jgi:hypothetical protein
MNPQIIKPITPDRLIKFIGYHPEVSQADETVLSGVRPIEELALKAVNLGLNEQHSTGNLYFHGTIINNKTS